MRRAPFREVHSVEYSMPRNTGCVGRGQTAWVTLLCGHVHHIKASSVPRKQMRCKKCKPAPDARGGEQK